uniref:Putative secreted protein n=1 Tax=Anopheles darlingi TaxID=43151 RepID=A0A2M4D0N2_ANODA
MLPSDHFTNRAFVSRCALPLLSILFLQRIVFSTFNFKRWRPSSSSVSSSSISSSYVSASNGRVSTDRKLGNLTKCMSRPRSVTIRGISTSIRVSGMGSCSGSGSFGSSQRANRSLLPSSSDERR